MAISLRAIAGCIGIRGEFRVRADFFGYRVSGAPLGAVSLRRQFYLLGGPHIHLDIILVGDLTQRQREFIDSAVFGARENFEQVPLGIGRVRYYRIDGEDGERFGTITSKSEAKKLTRRYRGPNDDAMDVFFVSSYAVSADGIAAVGLCNIAGCNKDLYAFNGCVMGLDSDVNGATLRTVMPHELGHGLRLGHDDDIDNLMYPDNVGDQRLTTRQKRRMLRDCFVREGCSG